MIDADAGEMTITLPGDVHYFRSVRLAVGGLAAYVGFDVAAIDDLRIGADELCAALAEVGGGGLLTLRIVSTPGEGLRIDGTTERVDAEIDADRLEFSRQILSVVADDFSIETGEGEARFWLVRSLAGPPDAPEP